MWLRVQLRTCGARVPVVGPESSKYVRHSGYEVYWELGTRVIAADTWYEVPGIPIRHWEK